jgi:hypothetical protein
MRKQFHLAFSLSFVTTFGLSTTTLAQTNITNPLTFTVKGGNTEVNAGKDPNIQIQEIQKGSSSDPNRQTWIVIHGWNDNPTNKDLRGIADTIKDQKPNDRVLMLDWKEASNIGWVPGSDTGKAATWISPVAKEVFNKLKEEGVLSQNLNLIGHSLGALLSSEIGKFFKNDSGVKINRIIALDPASELVGKYDIDGSIKGDQTMTPFKDVATVSKAFVGNTSAAGDKTLAATSGESYTIQFNQKNNPATGTIAYGRIGSLGSEHIGVVAVYNNLIKNGLPQEGGGKNDILGLESGNINIKRDAYSEFEGKIIANNSDSNQPYRLYVKDPQTSEEILLGEPDQKTKLGKIINGAVKGASDWFSSIFKFGTIPVHASGYEENQDISPQQVPNILMLNNINSITQSNVSHIGSASTDFVRNPIQNKITEQNAIIAEAKPLSIQEKSQYTNGQIIRTPFDITLTWNQNTPNPLDLDSHLATPNGEHVYFGNKGNLNSAPNAFLYRDSRPDIPAGLKGAEQIRVTQFQEGEYRFYVHNYSDDGATGNTLNPNRLSNSGAQVKLFEGGKPLTNIPNDPNNYNVNNPDIQAVGASYKDPMGKDVIYSVPTNKPGNTWSVFRLNNRTGILTPVNGFRNASTSNVPTLR